VEIAMHLFKQGENVVFLHTGGSVSLFAYPIIIDLPVYS
jgi:1-aminocyclopropane-1-carboxylate deaminase/D-cysteine desulfhydrase-like pyridoxal-dependent ACC family enzyme